jgi:hypothetical protein
MPNARGTAFVFTAKGKRVYMIQLTGTAGCKEPRSHSVFRILLNSFSPHTVQSCFLTFLFRRFQRVVEQRWICVVRNRFLAQI